MFPNPPAPGESFSLSVPCNPRNTTKEFVRKAVKLGFKALRLHDLRGSHETCLLDAGVPVDVVAPRCGHDSRQCCCGFTTSVRARRTCRGPKRLRPCPRGCSRAKDPLGPTWFQFSNLFL